MNLSFIAPRPKYIFPKISKIWVLYIFLSMMIVFGFLALVKYQIFLSQQRIQDYRNKQVFYQSETIKTRAYQDRILYEIDLAKSRQLHNSIVKDALINLFNIIPDQITISDIEAGNNFLKLKGLTPSKEVFRFLLQDPLKAIFGKSTVSFYALSNGWYHFVSHSESKASIIEVPKVEDDEEK